MPKFQADVSLDTLPTYGEWTGIGEERIRVICNRKEDIFDILTFYISQWVCGKRRINYEEYSFILTQCLEKLKVRPQVADTSKGKLLIHLSSIPMSYIKNYPEHLRKELLVLNRSYFFLLSPRSLGSEKWRRLEGIAFAVRILPGIPKSSITEPSRIGVGYRDKGHSRNKATDGSPTWQELSCVEIKVEPTRSAKKNASRSRRFFLAVLEESWTTLRQLQERRLRKRKRQWRDSILL